MIIASQLQTLIPQISFFPNFEFEIYVVVISSHCVNLITAISHVKEMGMEHSY